MTGLRRLVRLLVKGRPHGLRRRVFRMLFPSDVEEASSGRATPTPAPSTTAGRVLLAASELADGEVMELMIDGEPVALCRVGDSFHAVDGTCPHAGGPLGEGQLDGTELTCPYHGWSFDVRTGACLMDDELEVRPLPIRVVDGQVVLDVG